MSVLWPPRKKRARPSLLPISPRNRPDSARLLFADAAAWAPDPKNPPLYFDLPTKDGVPQPEIVAKFTANAPLVFIDQYIGNLKQYRAISIDVGDQDGLRFDTIKLHKILDDYGIANSFEIYSGTHTSAVADRFQNHVLPFLARTFALRKAVDSG